MSDDDDLSTTGGEWLVEAKVYPCILAACAALHAEPVTRKKGACFYLSMLAA
jgi:hypothetical protein